MAWWLSITIMRELVKYNVEKLKTAQHKQKTVKIR